jgi:hypothetical protein
MLALSILYLFSDQVHQLLGLARHDQPEDTWNLFYHLGGNGPWIQKHTTYGSVDDSLPENCRVDQVHMVGKAPWSLRAWPLTATDVSPR